MTDTTGTTDNSEMIQQFVMLTGAEINVAQQYLEMCNNNSDQAVQLYFDSGDPAPGGGEGGGAFGNNFSGGGNDAVRAPIDSFSDTLYGGQGRGFQYPGTVFQQPDPQPNEMEELFPPPVHLMYRGTFEDAKDEAKLKGKFVLVNIQDPTEFACIMLNRDVWSSELVQQLLKTYFIFMQLNHKSEEGQQFLSFYPTCNKFPTIAIVHPRTGELSKQLDGDLSTDQVLEQVTTFLDHNQPDPTSAPAPQIRPTTTNFGLPSDSEMMAATAWSLEAPRQTDSSGQRESNGQTDSNRGAAGGSVTQERDMIDNDLEDEHLPDVTGVNLEDLDVPEEPKEGGGEVTVIRFRMPDGGTRQRKFMTHNTLQQMLNFAQKESNDPTSRFTLKTTFPPKEFNNLSMTAKEADLVPRAMVVVEKVE